MAAVRATCSRLAFVRDRMVRGAVSDMSGNVQEWTDSRSGSAGVCLWWTFRHTDSLQGG